MPHEQRRSWVRRLGASLATGLAVSAVTALAVSSVTTDAAAAVGSPPASAAVGPNATTVARSASVADAALYPCAGFSGLDAVNPTSLVKQDYFKWGPYAAYKVGNGRGNINWRADPYSQPSWSTWFHSLLWIGRPIRDGAYGTSASRDPAALAKAVTIAKDWVSDNRYPWPAGAGAGVGTIRRATTLLCLREALVKIHGVTQPWLDASLVQHGQWLRDNYSGWTDHNIGTDQTVALLGIGCVLRRDDFRDLAAQRLANSITAVIDAQGVNNEQSIGYANWNHSLWGKAATYLQTCRVTTATAQAIHARRAALAAFLDSATTPLGVMHRLGDTPTMRLDASFSAAQRWVSTQGSQGTAPTQRVRVYSAGYVFGVSGWGNGARPLRQESSYSLRFGPARAAHGHHDHMSVTWATRGRDILVDPGYGEYNQAAWRKYALSAAAHNMMVIGAMVNTPATTLTRHTVGAKADFFEMADTIGAASRQRSVLVMSDPDVMVVFDRGVNPKAKTTFTQLWHLPPDQAVTLVKGGASAYRRNDTTRTVLLQLPAGRVAPAVVRTVSGSVKPIQGWYWADYFHKSKAPVVSFARSGTVARFLTAVVAAPHTSAVSVAVVGGSRTRTTYAITVGSSVARVNLYSDGTLSRG